MVEHKIISELVELNYDKLDEGSKIGMNTAEPQKGSNFSLYEFKVSRDYPIIAAGMEFDITEKYIVSELVTQILQPIRNLLGESIKILSAKREPELNSLIGGANNSDHIYCIAADITSESIAENTEEIAKKIWNTGIQKNIRQLIYYPKNGFIHVSINFWIKTDKNETWNWEERS